MQPCVQELEAARTEPGRWRTCQSSVSAAKRKMGEWPKPANEAPGGQEWGC